MTKETLLGRLDHKIKVDTNNYEMSNLLTSYPSHVLL
jgi:hypothetical protein